MIKIDDFPISICKSTSVLSELSCLLAGFSRRQWEESRTPLGGGLRMLSASGGPSGTEPRKATCPKRATRRKSRLYDSQETAPTVFEFPLGRRATGVCEINTHLDGAGIFNVPTRSPFFKVGGKMPNSS